MPKIRLTNKPFKQVKNHRKTIEVRLNDEKRQQFKIGDILEITNLKTGEIINTKITDLLHYKIFKELYSSNNPSEFGDNSTENLIKDIYKFYTKAEEEKYGALGIRLKLI